MRSGEIIEQTDLTLQISTANKLDAAAPGDAAGAATVRLDNLEGLN